MSYLKWDEKIITDFSDDSINTLYNQGYLFGRQEKGSLYQTRSLRIDMSKFELNSENRRILRKTEPLQMGLLPLPFPDYHWSIGKLAKDFYDTKFGDGTFSANKVKELFTDTTKSNFNSLFVYFSPPTSPSPSEPLPISTENIYGYCIAVQTNQIIHYSYPFYNLETAPKDMGLGMMTRAIVSAKEQGKKYIYLGSAQRPTDTYKLQFEGIEWFDGKNWQIDILEIKKLLLKI